MGPPDGEVGDPVGRIREGGGVGGKSSWDEVVCLFGEGEGGGEGGEVGREIWRCRGGVLAVLGGGMDVAEGTSRARRSPAAEGSLS